jgi:hypothetical protein
VQLGPERGMSVMMVLVFGYRCSATNDKADD